MSDTRFPPPRIKAWASTASVGELVGAVRDAAALRADTKDEAFRGQMVEVIEAAKWEIGSRCWRPESKTEAGAV